MVLLPLIYVGLILLVMYLLILHATVNIDVFTHSHAEATKYLLFNYFGPFVFYLAPLVIGGILLLFMIKPLFAKPPNQHETVILDREDEPLVFEFVERICELVNAPCPREIRVDMQANASAGFRHGFHSILLNDLTLTIGLPLAAGLDLRQFAGVLAHEFGHFAQHAGMRMTYIIRSVNFWFIRVVYERDYWDRDLALLSEEVEVGTGIVFWCARIFIWLTRMILWVLMMAGQAVSCFMLRQMEFDADSYEIQLSGSEAFESVFERLGVIACATQDTQQALEDCWLQRGLPDDLTTFMLRSIKQLPPERLEKLRKLARDRNTGYFDTHPADKDRIAAGKKVNAAGIIHLTCPATTLFHDFNDVSRNASIQFYHTVFRRAFKLDRVRPIAEFLQQQDEEHAAREVLTRYFQNSISPLRPLPLTVSTLVPPLVPDLAIATVKQVRQAMLASIKDYGDILKEYDAAEACTANIARASALLNARVAFEAKEFSLSGNNYKSVMAERAHAEAQKLSLDPRLGRFETKAAERLTSALSLLYVPEIAAKLSDSTALQHEAEMLLPVTSKIGRILPELVNMRNEQQALIVLLSRIKGNEKNALLITGLKSTVRKLHISLQKVYGTLGGLEYSFTHGREKRSVRSYVIPCLPPANDLNQIAEVSEKAVNRLFALHQQSLAKLACIGEKVESAAGIEPLPATERVTAIT
jgi:Zn-dependent protease with chaperone function